MIKVIVVHESDGYIISRHVEVVPDKGDKINLGSEQYLIKERVWDYADGRSVCLVVKEPEE